MEASVATEVREGDTPLIDAVRHDRAADVAALLAGGADPEAKQRGGDLQGFAPLMIAAHQGHAGAAEALLKAGADPHSKATSGDEDHGKTALRLATDQGHRGPIVALLQRAAHQVQLEVRVVGSGGGGGATKEGD